MKNKLGLRSWAEVSIVVWDRDRWKKLICPIGHFTVVCLVTWPWIGSEAGGDLVLIQTSLFSYVNAN